MADAVIETKKFIDQSTDTKYKVYTLLSAELIREEGDIRQGIR